MARSTRKSASPRRRPALPIATSQSPTMAARKSSAPDLPSVDSVAASLAAENIAPKVRKAWERAPQDSFQKGRGKKVWKRCDATQKSLSTRPEKDSGNIRVVKKRRLANGEGESMLEEARENGFARSTEAAARTTLAELKGASPRKRRVPTRSVTQKQSESPKLDLQNKIIAKPRRKSRRSSFFEPAIFDSPQKHPAPVAEAPTEVISDAIEAIEESTHDGGIPAESDPKPTTRIRPKSRRSSYFEPFMFESPRKTPRKQPTQIQLESVDEPVSEEKVSTKERLRSRPKSRRSSYFQPELFDSPPKAEVEIEQEAVEVTMLADTHAESGTEEEQPEVLTVAVDPETGIEYEIEEGELDRAYNAGILEEDYSEGGIAVAPEDDVPWYEVDQMTDGGAEAQLLEEAGAAELSTILEVDEPDSTIIDNQETETGPQATVQEETTAEGELSRISEADESLAPDMTEQPESVAETTTAALVPAEGADKAIVNDEPMGAKEMKVAIESSLLQHGTRTRRTRLSMPSTSTNLSPVKRETRKRRATQSPRKKSSVLEDFERQDSEPRGSDPDTVDEPLTDLPTTGACRSVGDDLLLSGETESDGDDIHKKSTVDAEEIDVTMADATFTNENSPASEVERIIQAVVAADDVEDSTIQDAPEQIEGGDVEEPTINTGLHICLEERTDSSMGDTPVASSPNLSPHSKAVKANVDDIAEGLTLTKRENAGSSPGLSPRKNPTKSAPHTQEELSDPVQISIDDLTTDMDADTAVLQDFLNRAAASKANRSDLIAKRESLSNRRDSDAIRQALASPRKPLEDKDPNSPSPHKKLQASPQHVTASPSAKDLLASNTDDETVDHLDIEPTTPSTRRSTRSRSSKILPPPSALPTPSRISIRTPSQESVVPKKTEAQELALLTRNNTRRNKGTSRSAPTRLQQLQAQGAHASDDEAPLKDGNNPKAAPKKRNITWDEQLVYFQNLEGDSVQLATALPIPVLLDASKDLDPSSQDELSLSSPGPKRKAKDPAGPSSSAPKVRRLRGLGASNGTPAKGLLTSSLLPDALHEEQALAKEAHKLPKPTKARKAAKTKGQATSDLQVSLHSTSEIPLPSQSAAAKTADGASAVSVPEPTIAKPKERKSRLAAPRKVVLPGVGASSAGKKIEDAGVVVSAPVTSALEGTPARRRARKVV